MYTVQYMKQLLYILKILFWDFIFVCKALFKPMYCKTRRQVNQHDCLPSLLGDGDIWIEIVYDEQKIFGTGPTGAAKTW
jgi:hypothetical protein